MLAEECSNMPFEGDIQNYAPAEVAPVDEIGQIILKARDLLSVPEKWSKGDYTMRHVIEGECVCEAFCILGAIGFRHDYDPTDAQTNAAIRLSLMLNPGEVDFVDVIAGF